MAHLFAKDALSIDLALYDLEVISQCIKDVIQLDSM